MKKSFVNGAFIISILFLAASCASFPFFGGRGAEQELAFADPEAHIPVEVRARPRLAILPFYGGVSEEGDTVAMIFSHQPALLDAFIVLPRTAAFDTIIRYYGAELTGLTDSDAIARIGRQLDAHYVLSGSIRRLGGRNLLIATLVNVETFEQVAGYYQTYDTIADVPLVLPSMAQGLVDSALRRGERHESLAIIPFRHGAGIDPHDAYTLTQILAIELINAGRYAILPRTSAIQAALAGGDAAAGRAINADFVLSGTITRLGDINLFAAQVIHVTDGSLLVGDNRNYQVIADGIGLMPYMAIYLTYLPGDPGRARMIAERQEAERLRLEAEAAEARRLQALAAADAAELRRIQEERDAEARRIRDEAEAAQRRMRLEAEAETARRLQREAEATRRRERAEAARLRRISATRNERESFSLAYAWERGADADDRSGINLGLFLSGLYWAPFPYINLGLETRITLLTDLARMFDEDSGIPPIGWYFSVSPVIGAVIPLGPASMLFINAMLDLGRMPHDGIINDDFFLGMGITPSFSAGFSFGRRGTFNLMYRIVLYENRNFLHSAGFGAGRRF